MQTFYIEVTADLQATATHPDILTDEERQFLEGEKEWL